MIILSDGAVNNILFIQFNKNQGWADTQVLKMEWFSLKLKLKERIPISTLQRARSCM
jgi:hypothetical protein